MQNSLRQQVFPSFETDKKWTGGRQNADKHPDQNLTGLVSKYITKGLPDPVWMAATKSCSGYRFATSSSRLVSAPTWKRWRRR